MHTFVCTHIHTHIYAHIYTYITLLGPTYVHIYSDGQSWNNLMCANCRCAWSVGPNQTAAVAAHEACGPGLDHQDSRTKTGEEPEVPSAPGLLRDCNNEGKGHEWLNHLTWTWLREHWQL